MTKAHIGLATGIGLLVLCFFSNSKKTTDYVLSLLNPFSWIKLVLLALVIFLAFALVFRSQATPQEVVEKAKAVFQRILGYLGTG